VWTEDKRVDLTLTPQTIRKIQLNLGWLYTRGRQALGPYHGHLTLDSGEVLKVQDLFGLYEWVDQKW